MAGGIFLRALAIALVIAGGAYLIFALLGYAWYAWGFFGALLLVGAILLAIAWMSDRREARRRAVV